MEPRQSDIRSESNRVELALAIKLVLASRDFAGGDPSRHLAMIDWLLEHEEPNPGNTAHRPVRLFVEAIKATDGTGEITETER